MRLLHEEKDVPKDEKRRKAQRMKKLTGYMAGVNLGGWISQYKGNLERNPDKHFDTFITEADIQQIASWGMDHIRIPFDYSLIEYDESTGKYNEFGFLYLDKCLEWCKKARLNLIIDLHQAPGFSFDTPDANTLFDSIEQQDRFVDLWRCIAERYKGEGENLMFELLNEIVEKTADRWNALATRTIKAVREIDKEHWIVVGGIDYNSVWRLREMPIFDDDKIVYNFHMYVPMQLTHQHASWTMLKDYPGDFKYPSDMKPYKEFLTYQKKFYSETPRYDEHIYNQLDVMDKQFVHAFLQPAKDFIDTYNVPLYCGEYGVIALADLDSRTNWAQDVAEFCVANGIGRAMWSYRGMSFTMVDEDGRTLHKGLAKAAAWYY